MMLYLIIIQLAIIVTLLIAILNKKQPPPQPLSYEDKNRLEELDQSIKALNKSVLLLTGCFAKTPKK